MLRGLCVTQEESDCDLCLSDLHPSLGIGRDAVWRYREEGESGRGFAHKQLRLRRAAGLAYTRCQRIERCWWDYMIRRLDNWVPRDCRKISPLEKMRCKWNMNELEVVLTSRVRGRPAEKHHSLPFPDRHRTPLVGFEVFQVLKKAGEKRQRNITFMLNIYSTFNVIVIFSPKTIYATISEPHKPWKPWRSVYADVVNSLQLGWGLYHHPLSLFIEKARDSCWLRLQ